MATDSKIILSKVRVEHSQDALEEAGLLFRAQKYKGAANRSYYAVFHAMRAVLALDGYDSKKHSGVISEFRKLYIKTKIFPNDISNIVSNLFNITMVIYFITALINNIILGILGIINIIITIIINSNIIINLKENYLK